jgi:hypothetical protein
MQYSLRIPDEDELMPEYCLWMYETPGDILELEIWRKSWLIWKKNITKIYELSVIEYVFTLWGVYKKNKNTHLFKKRFFPTGMTVITKLSRYGVIVKIKYDNITVFACYVLHYIETQRILWLNYSALANFKILHHDKINHLYIYVHDAEPNDEVVESNISTDIKKREFSGKGLQGTEASSLLTSGIASLEHKQKKFESELLDPVATTTSRIKVTYKKSDTPRTNTYGNFSSF